MYKIRERTPVFWLTIQMNTIVRAGTKLQQATQLKSPMWVLRTLILVAPLGLIICITKQLEWRSWRVVLNPGTLVWDVSVLPIRQNFYLVDRHCRWKWNPWLYRKTWKQWSNLQRHVIDLNKTMAFWSTKFLWTFKPNKN